MLEPRTISKADALAEAYKRGLLPPDKKAAYEEAQRRGLVGGQGKPSAPVQQGGGFDMAPSSPAARRDMLTPKPAPAPMAAAPGAQYSFQPTPEMQGSAPIRAAIAENDQQQRAAGRIPLTTDRGGGYVADPAKQMADMAVAQREERDRQERREASRVNMGDMLVTQDERGRLQPGTETDRDIGKGIVTSPVRVANAAIGAAESAINLPSDIVNAVSDEYYKTGNTQTSDQVRAPRLEAPRVPLPAELESMSGQLTEGLAQFLLTRGAIGKLAPGGGLATQLGKDAIAVGVGFDGSTGRVADMIDVNAIPEGPLRDYAAWLKTQPDDSPLVGRLKNLIEDMTFSGPMLAPQGAVRGVQAVGNALNPAAVPTNAGGAAVQAARQGQPQPSVAPVAAPPVSQGPGRTAQSGTPGAGQQAPGGPATLPASPTTVQSPQAASLASSDAKIIRRLLVAGGVARNDVDRLLGDMVHQFNLSNDPRSRLAFFAEEYLPTKLDKPVADDVIQKLRGFGRERYGANSPRDPSRSIMRTNIGELRGSQREFLTDEFEGLLGKETLMNKQGKITRDKQGVAEAVYREEIGRQQRLLADGKATPEQMAARDDLLLLMGREDFFKQVPAELHLKAADEGKSLWEFVHQNPLEAAHWMQSELGVLARKGNTIAQTMRMPLVRRLEDAVPGYRGARLEYGDLSGQQAALEFGDDLYRVAASKFDTDNKALEFKKLSPAQKTVAKKSIRDKLLNEFRKAKTGDDQAAVITAMQKDGVLDALETVLGPDGKKVADAIRGMVKENDRIRAVDLLSGSNTADNLAQQQAAREAVRSPVNKAIGAIGDEGSYLQTGFADLVSVALGLPPVWTAGKVGTGLVGKLGSPSKKKLASATQTLYGKAPRNALKVEAPKPGPAKPRAPGKPRVPKPPVTQEDFDALLAQYDKTPTPAIRNKIIAARKALGQPSNALKAPGKPPAKKPPPGTTSQSPAALTSAVVAGTGAYVASDGDPLATAAAAAGGGFLGNKLSKLGSGPKAPPKVGGGAKGREFDTSRVFYHGTTNQFDEFNGPTWLSTDRDYASDFSWATKDEIARGVAAPNVVEAYVRGSLKKVSNKEIEQLGYDEAAMRVYKGEGYDGVQSPDGQVLIFDPKNIRRVDPAPPKVRAPVGGKGAEAASAPPKPSATVSSVPQSRTVAKVTTADGRGYEVTADVIKDRDAVVMSPAWPSNIAEDLTNAIVHQRSRNRARASGMDLANDPPRSPDWAEQNPQEWASVQKQIGERFLGMARSTPGDAHILALVDGVDVNSLGSFLEANLPAGKRLLISPANGEIAIVSKGANLPQFETWTNLSPRYNQSMGLLPPPAEWATGGVAQTPSRSNVKPLAPKPPSKPDSMGMKPAPKGPPRNKLSAFPGADEAPQKSLAVVHNLTEANLLHADELGGLAAPSLAVVDTAKGALSNFGEISLIARPEILNSRGVRTFDSDIYSPRHPRAEYKLTDREVRAVNQELNDATKELGDLRDIDWDGMAKEGPAALVRNDRVRAAFLKSTGNMPARLPKKKVPDDISPEHLELARLPIVSEPFWAVRESPDVQRLARQHFDNEVAKVREVDPEVANDMLRTYIEVGEDGVERMHQNVIYRFVNDAKVAKNAMSGQVDAVELSSIMSKKLRNPKLASAFDDYVANLAQRVTDGRRLFKGFTYNGNRRYSPYTMDNILREMTRSLQGGENWYYGAGSIRAKYAKEMKSIEAIRRNKSKLVAEGGMDAAKDEAQKKLIALLEYLSPFYRFGGGNKFMAMDDMGKAIMEGPSGIREAFDFKGNPQPMQRIREFIEELRAMPTEYFEAKANRAVGLNEFATAVVPRGASPKVIDALKRAGVKIRYYNKSDPTSRAKAIQNERSALFAFPGGAASQAAAGAGGAAYGYANPVDANEDGVIDDQDRAITSSTLGFGALTATGLARNALSKGPRGTATTSAFGSRPKPPPSQMGFTGGKGTKPPPKEPRPVMGKRTINALNQAARSLPPEVRNKLKANAALPPGARKSAAEATGDDPAIYRMTAPFQNAKPGPIMRQAERVPTISGKSAFPRPANPIDAGVNASLDRIERNVGPPRSLDPIAEAAGIAEKRRRAAVAEASRWNARTNTQTREAMGLPDLPLPKSLARNEQEATELAIKAKQALAAANLETTLAQEARAWAEQRKQAIIDALMNQPASAQRSGPNAAGVQVGGANSAVPPVRPPKPVSYDDARDMADLIFDAEYAKLLDDVLSGKTKPRNRDQHHMALIAASLSVPAGIGALAVANDFASQAKPPPQETAEDPQTYMNPGDPRYVWDWDKVKSNRRAVQAIQINLNALPPNQDGGRYNLSIDAWGPKTEAALKHWQYENGFTPDGAMTAEQWELLDQQAIEGRRSGQSRTAQRR